MLTSIFFVKKHIILILQKTFILKFINIFNIFYKRIKENTIKIVQKSSFKYHNFCSNTNFALAVIVTDTIKYFSLKY